MSANLPGRPTTYTADLAERIATLYAEGRSWREVAAMPGMPAWATIHGWMEDHEGFRHALARARRSKADEAAHEAGRVLEACDVDREPTKTASARVTLASARSNYLRWLAGCLDRDTYGDRPPVVAVQVTSNVIVALDRLAGRAVAGEE